VNCVHSFSNWSRALFSSARHCWSVLSKLKLSPIFAAARQAGSTLRLGTLSATTSSNVPPSASITPEESMWRLLLTRVVRSGTAPDARAPAIHRLNGCRRCSDQNGLTMPPAVTRPLAIQSNCARRIHCRRGTPRPSPERGNAAFLALLELLRARCRGGLELATIEHGIIALLALLETHVRGEHVGAAFWLL